MRHCFLLCDFMTREGARGGREWLRARVHCVIESPDNNRSLAARKESETVSVVCSRWLRELRWTGCEVSGWFQEVIQLNFHSPINAEHGRGPTAWGKKLRRGTRNFTLNLFMSRGHQINTFRHFCLPASTRKRKKKAALRLFNRSLL